jgi:hypothetical protein
MPTNNNITAGVFITHLKNINDSIKRYEVILEMNGNANVVGCKQILYKRMREKLPHIVVSTFPGQNILGGVEIFVDAPGTIVISSTNAMALYAIIREVL